jgi:hypothetical protein
MKLIKGYLNSYNLNIESKLRKENIRRRLRKLSTNKIFVSDGEFKHTNDIVNITLYVNNRQKRRDRQTYVYIHSKFKWKSPSITCFSMLSNVCIRFN